MPPSPPDPDLLHRIPLTARSVLHVGCGHGELAAAYRVLNPKSRLFGIEPDLAAAASATPYFHSLATVDVEAEPLPFNVPGGIDCIIYSGILERLRDPWRLIRRHAEALSRDGMMLICVANSDHWRHADRLLRGSSDNENVAGTTAPHHRWFTADRMRAELTEAGLSLCDVMARDQDSDRQAARRFIDSIAPGLTALGTDPDSYASRATPTHFIWRARLAATPRMIVSASMLNPVGGVSHVRVVHPLQAIGSDPSLTVGVVDQLDLGQAHDGAARIFVLHRPALMAEPGHEKLRALSDAGYLLVTEFDDHPDFFQMMQLGGALSFRGVHAVQTSTPALANVLRQYNPEVAVFPNAIPALPPVRNFRGDGPVTLFFGALNREDDYRTLMPAINSVAAKAGDRLRFQVVHDRQFFDALDTPFKTFAPTSDYDTYLALLGSSEISFMPLSDTPFNRAKSDLKFIEAGACRAAPLASTVVYGDSIQDGRTGLLFRDGSELHDRLMRLVAMPDVARTLADAARQYVADERMLAYQVGSRIAWYRSLWRRRASLTAALHARMRTQQAAEQSTT